MYTCNADTFLHRSSLQIWVPICMFNKRGQDGANLIVPINFPTTTFGNEIWGAFANELGFHSMGMAEIKFPVNIVMLDTVMLSQRERCPAHPASKSMFQPFIPMLYTPTHAEPPLPLSCCLCLKKNFSASSDTTCNITPMSMAANWLVFLCTNANPLFCDMRLSFQCPIPLKKEWN